MLYWICPECGHECSPAIRECPTCTAPPAGVTPLVSSPGATSPGPSNNELLSLAQNFQSASSVGLLAPPAMVPVQLSMKEEPVEAAPPREPELSRYLAPLDCETIQAARPRLWDPMKVNPAPVPARISSPALATAAATCAKVGLKPAGPQPAGEIKFRVASGGDTEAFDQLAEPLFSRRQSVAFVRAELPMAERGGLALADLTEAPADPGDARLKPVVPYRNGQPGHGISAPLAYRTNGPSLVASRLKLAGESLVDLMNALKASAEEFDRAAIEALQSSFLEEPAMGLLSAPEEIVASPAPPAEQFMRAQKPIFTAIAPENTSAAAVMIGPQGPTLAGPSLPPQLLNFHKNSSLRGNRRRMPTWPLALLVVLAVFLGGGSLYQYLTQDRDAKAVSAAAPAPSSKAAPAPRVRVVEEHPAARSVEVAGVRVVSGPNKKPQLEYIVINHSSNELTGLNVRIAVRSVEALADAPLFSVSSIVASLGPNQSREIRTDLDPSVQPSAIPDWQSLRTEVLVARQ